MTASRDGADCHGRLAFQDLADSLDLAVKLSKAFGCQLGKGFDGDIDFAADITWAWTPQS